MASCDLRSSALVALSCAVGCARLVGIDELGFRDADCVGLPSSGCSGSGGSAGAAAAGDAGAGEQPGSAGAAQKPDAGANCSAASALELGLDLEVAASCAGFAADPCSLASFEAAAVALPDDGVVRGGLLIDGDVVLPDAAALRAYHTELIAGAERDLPTVRRPWPASAKRALDYCVDAAFGSSHDQVLAVTLAAAAAWEQLADVRFVHVAGFDGSCDEANVALRIRFAPSSVRHSAVYPAEPSARIVLGPGALATNAFPDLGGTLRHAFGHVLGLDHTTPQQQPCAGSDCQRTAAYRAASIMRRSWCAERTGKRLYPAQIDGDVLARAYWAPTDVARDASTIVARNSVDGRVYARGDVDGWLPSAGVTRELASSPAGIFRATPEGAVEIRRDSGSWLTIATQAGRIFGCLDSVCMTSAQTGAVSTWDGSTWKEIGGLARRCDATRSAIYRIALDGGTDEYAAADETGTRFWRRIRNAEAGRLLTGTTDAYVTNLERPLDDSVERWVGAELRWKEELSGYRSYVGLPSALGAISLSNELLAYSVVCCQNVTSLGDAGVRTQRANGDVFRLESDGSISVYEPARWRVLGAP